MLFFILQEQECSESDGWCVADYQNRAREMMSAAHEQLYRQYQRERGIIFLMRFFLRS